MISRRSFIAGTLAGAAVASTRSRAAGARKPNVIVILTDDQGSVDAPGFGATDLVMPHIDALANRGTRFTQFYSAAPVCSPSRAALLTGKYPLRAGMPTNAPGDDRPLERFAMQTTMANMFKSAGYKTAHIGKWHLGSAPDCLPNARGFDHSFGHLGGCIDNYSHFFYWAGPNRHDLFRNGTEVYEDGKYFLDLMVRETKGFISAHRDEPFFIYFAANAPHYPYQPDAKRLQQFAALSYPRNLYAAFLASLDDRIGEVMQHIDACGLTNDTIVVFQSDNGHSVEERAHSGGGSAGAYRGEKFSLFEGGVRVPAFISWPGNLPESQTRAQVAHACDWFPTLAELCGLAMSRDIDGASLVNVVREDAASPHEVLHWQVGEGDRAAWAVREGDWKLVYQPGKDATGDSYFLANLADDAQESTNKAAEHEERVTRLRELHNAWVRDALA
ncbi:MAG TPA: sulfatase-like hydrolase/transferase [Candidatus Hydrogenedentes bacterium]|nr:sulfatase-like hydrolase/transferase [Candidatus Hydrogenedentota bacterium]